MTENNQLDVYIIIGNTLKEIRKEKKLTIEHMEKLSGQNVSRISRAENGKLNLTLGWIIHYCNVLNINPTDFFIRAFFGEKEAKKLEKLNRIFEEFATYELEKNPNEKD